MSENISSINRDKYNKEDAFNYLDDRWHRVRVEKSLNLIKRYRDKNGGYLKALDVGCGDGDIGSKIKKLGIETWGIDVAENSLVKSQEKGLHIVNGDIQKRLPFEDASLDVVFAGEVIEHIADPRYFVTEVNRVLKLGGMFVLTTPNLAGLDNRFKLLVGKIPRCIEPLSSHHYQHVRPFTLSSLREFLKRGGFTPTDLKSNRIKVTSFLQSYVLANLFPSLGASLIIGANKTETVKKIQLNRK